jgi:hypothetical protein
MFLLGLSFDLCVLHPMLFFLFLSQVTLALIPVVASVVVPLLARKTFSMLLTEPLRMST